MKLFELFYESELDTSDLLKYDKAISTALSKNESIKKSKSKLVRKKLRVKSKRHRKHVHPVKQVTDENIIGDYVSKAATWAAGKVLAKLSTGGT
jgi:transposase